MIPPTKAAEILDDLDYYGVGFTRDDLSFIDAVTRKVDNGESLTEDEADRLCYLQQNNTGYRDD